MLAAECLDVADQTLLLDGEGGVTLEYNSQNAELRSKVQELGTMMGVGSFEKAESDSKPVTTKKDTGKTDLELLLARKRQDISLYAMFINSIGKRVFSPWILVAMCVPLGESMIGM